MHTKPQAFVNGQPVNGGMVTKTYRVTKPRYARLPHWILSILAWFIETTEEKQAEVFELKEAPKAGAYTVVTYQTNFGED